MHPTDIHGSWGTWLGTGGCRKASDPTDQIFEYLKYPVKGRKRSASNIWIFEISGQRFAYNARGCLKVGHQSRVLGGWLPGRLQRLIILDLNIKLNILNEKTAKGSDWWENTKICFQPTKKKTFFLWSDCVSSHLFPVAVVWQRRCVHCCPKGGTRSFTFTFYFYFLILLLLFPFHFTFTFTKAT